MQQALTPFRFSGNNVTACLMRHVNRSMPACAACEVQVLWSPDLSHREGVKRCEEHAHQGVGMSWQFTREGKLLRQSLTPLRLGRQ